MREYGSDKSVSSFITRPETGIVERASVACSEISIFFFMTNNCKFGSSILIFFLTPKERFTLIFQSISNDYSCRQKYRIRCITGFSYSPYLRKHMTLELPHHPPHPQEISSEITKWTASLAHAHQIEPMLSLSAKQKATCLHEQTGSSQNRYRNYPNRVLSSSLDTLTRVCLERSTREEKLQKKTRKRVRSVRDR